MNILILHQAIAPTADAAERDVLVQVDVVTAALRQLGHTVAVRPCDLDLAGLARHLDAARPDVVFNLVESLGGSDRMSIAVAGLLEQRRVPFTGSGLTATMTTTHKPTAKRLLREAGLPTPPWVEQGQAAIRALDGSLAGPVKWIIKSDWEHASAGLDEHSLLETANLQVLDARLMQQHRDAGGQWFAESFIDGREFNLSLLERPDGMAVLPPAEIDFSAFPVGKPRLVGQRAKWDDQSFEFHHTPRRFLEAGEDHDLARQLICLTLRCAEVFGLRGYARVDFRVDRGGHPWILEVNTNPCLSPDAGYAAALARAGIDWAAAVGEILAAATRSS